MENSSSILAFDVEFNSLTGSVFQIGAAKFRADGEIEIFNAITPSMLISCSEKKVKQRFNGSKSNTILGSFPAILRAFLEFAENSNFILSWGCVDGVVLTKEAERMCLNLEKEVFTTFFDKFVDLQRVYMKRMKRGGNHLIDALNVFGIEFVGTPHDAATDAFNTLLVANKMVRNEKAYLSSAYGNSLWSYLSLPYDEWLYSDDKSSIANYIHFESESA